jgi:hypothetical protein
MSLFGISGEAGEAFIYFKGAAASKGDDDLRPPPKRKKCILPLNLPSNWVIMQEFGFLCQCVIFLKII